MTILIAGHTGLVGSAVYEYFQNKGEDVIGVSSSTVNLLDRKRVFDFLSDIKPTVVINAAAIVGGIGANSKSPVQFLSENLQTQTNLMDASHQADVERLLFLGSACIYPRECSQPIKEEYLLSGPLEPTNSAYAIAKISGLKLVESYRKQYKRRWISVMPTNIYGIRDNFSLESGHVFGALINRFVNAVENNLSEVTLWGTGSAKREFLNSRDLAEAVSLLLDSYDDDLHINVGTGEDIAISELANRIAIECGFKGSINWDKTKSDGTPRRCLDVTKINSLGWYPKVSLNEGIKEVLTWFKASQGQIRV